MWRAKPANGSAKHFAASRNPKGDSRRWSARFSATSPRKQASNGLRLYRCTWPDDRDHIRRNGLRGRPPFEDRVFAWSTFDQADTYRQHLNASGWADIWSFDDEGRSRLSPESGDGGRVLDGTVPPEKLIGLEYDAYSSHD